MSRLTFIVFLSLTALPLAAQPIVMFPGDANNDGVANQYDLLPIGVAYGQEGFPRPGASPEWVPQFHPQQWPVKLPVSGVNLGFCDSDGNGLIDSLDVDAIALNFDSMQNEALPPPVPYVLPDTCFSCPCPDLLITFDRDTALINDTFYAILTLRYPTGLDPAVGALGIAFNLQYDPQNIKDSLTKVFPDTMPGDLLFVAATSTLARFWRAVPPGNIGFGAAGKGANALWFTRPLGAVELVVEDMIIRSTADEFWMEAADFLILNAGEQAICLGKVEVDTIVLFDPLSAVRGPEDGEDGITVFPNPATRWLSVESPEWPVEKIECFSMSGARLEAGWSGFSYAVTLSLDSLPAGVFLVKIQSANGISVKKLVRKP